jgi:uncharacterized protein
VAISSHDARPVPGHVDEPTARLEGVDVARALALAGMFLTHLVRSYRSTDPGWLQVIDNVPDGRAAPLFCVLLGVSAGLLVGRGTPDRVLLARGVVVFVLGLAVWPYTHRVFHILAHYGVLLATVPLWRRLPNRCLLVVAAAAFLVPSAVVATVADTGLRMGGQPQRYADLADAAALARNLLWTGGYPLSGWLGFLLVGLWLARQPLRDKSAQRRLLVAGAAIALTQPLLSVAYERSGGRPRPGRPEGLAAFFDATAHSNRTAWYVVGAATAAVVLMMCLALTQRRPRWSVPPTRLGQLALTAYLAHLVLGEQWLWPLYDRTRPPEVLQLAVLGAVLVVFAAAATAYRARLRRGPVEALTRTLSELLAGRIGAGRQRPTAG